MPDDPFPGGPAASHGSLAIAPLASPPVPPPFAFAAYGLRPIEHSDRGTFARFFAPLACPLSDFTFSQIYTWRNSLHLSWTVLAGHLCVFANGSGDLTMLMPPIGESGDVAAGDSALRQAFDLMDTYNAAQGVPDRSRIEYVSDELLARFSRAGLSVTPMATDYVYDTARMIDLPGGELASKRQAKNRFLRRYQHRVETYDAARHLDGCLQLLAGWRSHQDTQHQQDAGINAIKRHKEAVATELALRDASQLNLHGMVVYVRDAGQGEGATGGSATVARQGAGAHRVDGDGFSLRGFTFGETLGSDQSSIVIEKTDLTITGLAQFIFSEFCRTAWADRPLTNVGDDWGLESLAWTKMSYRPVKLLQKYMLTAARPTAVAMDGLRPMATDATSAQAEAEAPAVGPTIRQAARCDLDAAIALEQACFAADLSLKKRQLQYLQSRPSAVFLVADRAGTVVGQGIALVRRSRHGSTGTASGRIYSLAVHRQHRGQKIGGQLLRAMVRQLRERGVRRVYLEVSHDNAEAIALYERNGFQPIGRLSDYYGPQLDALHMMHECETPAASG
jgi:ribosomal protein S18 acetylase RimI-like enzyme